MTDERIFELATKIANSYRKEFKVSKEEAEDCAMATFINVKRNKGFSFSYVRITVMNYYRDVKRSGWAKNVRIASNGSSGVAHELIAATDNLDSEELLSKMVGQSLPSNMKEEYKDPFILDLMGYSAKDGARIIGITVPSYKSRLYRGREFLEKRINVNLLSV